MKNVTLLTTMWSGMDETTGLEREHQLKTQLWQPMILRGSRMLRFDSTPKSAWSIIDQFVIPYEHPSENEEAERMPSSLAKTITQIFKKTTMKEKS